MNEIKLCECGCGLPAPIATKNNTKNGYVIGQPKRFVSGHQKRGIRRQGYIKDAIGYIPLTRGKWSLVDAHNFAWLSQWNWLAHRGSKKGRWYAARSVWLGAGKQHIQYMALVVMGVTDPKIQVDHKDHENTLDNREANLRLTVSQNQQNIGLTRRNKSGFKGVSWHKASGKWRAQIKFKGKVIHLGSFNTAVEAALAHDAAALLYHKEFAVLNFPPKKPAASMSTAATERKLA